jgi:hypothetical protein
MRSPHGDQINDDPIITRIRRILLVAMMTQLLACLILSLNGIQALQQSILVLALSIQAGVLLGAAVQQGTIRRLIAMAKAKNITKKKFKAAMGRDPVQDELERCNCAAAGRIGHWGCGWCEEHNKPMFACPCMRRRMEETERMATVTLNYELDLSRPPLRDIVTVNLTVAPVRMGSDAPRGPEGPKVVRPMTEVEKEIARADMAFLIAKEKESGDWDKWQESQKHWTGAGVQRDLRTGRFRAR